MVITSSIEKPAQPNRSLLALGILQGYISNPLWFLIESIITLPNFIKQINKEYPKEFIRATALQSWMYIRLKKQLGREKAYEIIRAVVLPIGLTIQQGNLRNVEASRRFTELIHYQQRNNREGMTRWNKMQILEQTDTKYEIRITECMYYKFYQSLGIPEMTRMMCAVDNAIFSSYLPEVITFHRNGLGNRMVDGAKECEFVIENNNPSTMNNK